MHPSCWEEGRVSPWINLLWKALNYTWKQASSQYNSQSKGIMNALLGADITVDAHSDQLKLLDALQGQPQVECIKINPLWKQCRVWLDGPWAHGEKSRIIIENITSGEEE